MLFEVREQKTHCLLQKLEELGATVRLADPGEQKLKDGSTIKLPPVILGQLGVDKSKKTLLIYGHLDVQPATVEVCSRC